MNLTEARKLLSVLDIRARAHLNEVHKALQAAEDDGYEILVEVMPKAPLAMGRKRQRLSAHMTRALYNSPEVAEALQAVEASKAAK